jgi:hypothetical protein
MGQVLMMSLQSKSDDIIMFPPNEPNCCAILQNLGHDQYVWVRSHPTQLSGGSQFQSTYILAKMLVLTSYLSLEIHYHKHMITIPNIFGSVTPYNHEFTEV